MKLLLTSGGISNASIHNAFVDLLGKPIAESSTLFIPTAIYALRAWSQTDQILVAYAMEAKASHR